MKTLIIDTETNGKPINYRAPISDLENWPRVIQIGWQLADMETEQVLMSGSYLVKPDGWVVPKEEFWINNGFSTERNESEGHPMPGVLDLFIEHLNEADIIVAHNLEFDYPIVAAEMLRYGKAASKDRQRLKVCTKEVSTHYCKIPFPGRRDTRSWVKQTYKWPTLTELHLKLFGKDFDGAHDAFNDVTACRLCFFELMRRGVFGIEKDATGKLNLSI